MSLRDHFRPPVNNKHRWNELHGMWPMMIVRQLFDLLPAGYVAAPSVRLGKLFDVSAYQEDPLAGAAARLRTGNGGVATAAAPAPTLTLETYLADQDEFEVRVYDTEVGRQLVAAIEIVSPSNKDRPENRRAFTAKVAALLQNEVCVSVVDLVTTCQFNLYAELLELIGAADPQLGANPPAVYSVTIRSRKKLEGPSLLELWYHPMTVGQPLPTLPVWLSAELRVLLPLEAGYEETCRLLHIA